jgi:hypothetical protein
LWNLAQNTWGKWLSSNILENASALRQRKFARGLAKSGPEYRRQLTEENLHGVLLRQIGRLNGKWHLKTGDKKISITTFLVIQKLRYVGEIHDTEH